MQHDVHSDHDHVHSASCGHTRIQHEGHVDYVHDGCLHSEHAGHYDEHAIAVSTANPGDCNQADCDCGHDGDCNHEQIPHGDHVDHLHAGRLHHAQGDHVDDHGAVATL